METVQYEIVGAGEGAPVIVLPGGAARNPAYLGDVRAWGIGRPAVIVHYRGTPRTGGTPVPWCDQFDDLEAVRNEVGLDSVEVLAHSAGATVALAYAAAGAPVSRVGLVTPPATWLTGTESDAAELAKARSSEDAIQEALAAPPLDFTEDEATFRDLEAVTAPLGYAKWDVAAQEHSRIGPTNLDHMRAFFFTQPPDDLFDRIRSLTMPIHIIGGAGDLLSGNAPVHALAEVFSHGSIEMIDDCGHYPWVDQPDGFAAAVARWSSAG